MGAIRRNSGETWQRDERADSPVPGGRRQNVVDADPPRGLGSGAEFSLPAPEPEPRVKGFTLPHLNNPFADAKPLGEREIRALRPVLMDAIRYCAEYADRGISETNKRHTKAYIWESMDKDEIEKIADFLIRRGARSGTAAQIVRGTVEAYQEIEILIIMGPRIWDTWRFYRDNGGFGL